MEALGQWCVGETLEEGADGSTDDVDLMKANCAVGFDSQLKALEKAIAGAK